jgi:hypothetical protein
MVRALFHLWWCAPAAHEDLCVKRNLPRGYVFGNARWSKFAYASIDSLFWRGSFEHFSRVCQSP